MIKVPIQQSQQQQGSQQASFVVISEDQLPNDAQKIISLLHREQASIEHWLEIALLYYRKGNYSAFQAILHEALNSKSIDDNIQRRYLYDNESQRIRAMNVLAGLQFHLAEAEIDSDKKKVQRQAGISLMNEAFQQYPNAPDIYISRCFYEIAIGQLKDAAKELESCEERLKECQKDAREDKDFTGWQQKALGHLCLLARAIIQFNKAQYPQAAQHLKEILRNIPYGAPSDLWYALSLCYHRMGNLPKAKLGFEKVVQMEPSHSMALCCLAVCELTMNVTDAETRKKAFNLFKRSFDANPRNLLALRHLADQLCIRGEYDACKEICESALQILEHKRQLMGGSSQKPDLASFRHDLEILRSSLYFILGKLHHKQQDFNKAFEQYEKCLKSNPKNFSAHFQMAKIQYSFHNYSAAEQHLHQIISSTQFKDCYEALRLLGLIKARGSRDGHVEAVRLFKRVLELNPNDFEVNFEIASLYEQNDPAQALPFYEAGIQVMKNQIDSKTTDKNKFINVWQSSYADYKAIPELAASMVPPELLSNLATLMIEVGRTKEALVYLEEALENTETMLRELDCPRVKALQQTIRFNIAYCTEQEDISSAQKQYQKIIDTEPTYTDAYLRMAYIERDHKKNYQNALAFVDQAIQNHIKKPGYSLPTNIHCFKALMLQQAGNHKEAYREFDYAKQISKGQDSYSRVGIANSNYHISTLCRNDVNRQEQYLSTAMQGYFRILDIDDHNCSGSLGISNVLCEYGKIAQANEVYKLLALSEPNSLVGRHSLVNQGHIATWAQEYDKAINLYNSAIEQIQRVQKNQSLEWLEIKLYLSKVYFKKNDHEQCLQILNSLLESYPNELRVLFNLASCHYQHAIKILEGSEREVWQTKEAINEIHIANDLFTRILKSTGGSNELQIQVAPQLASSEDLRQISQKIHEKSDQTKMRLQQNLSIADIVLQQDEKSALEKMQEQQAKEQAQREKERQEREARDKAELQELERKQAQKDQFSKMQFQLSKVQPLDLTPDPKTAKGKKGAKPKEQQSDNENIDSDDALCGDDLNAYAKATNQDYGDGFDDAIPGAEDKQQTEIKNDDDFAKKLEHDRKKQEKKDAKKAAKKEAKKAAKLKAKTDQGDDVGEGEVQETQQVVGKKRLRKNADEPGAGQDQEGAEEKRQKTE